MIRSKIAIKNKAVFIAATMLFTSTAQAGTKTADFLQWSRKSQQSYFQIAIGMAGVVATQVKPKIATCIDNWYFQSKALQRQREEEILTAMKSYKAYQPHAVILAYIQKACGKFKSDN